MINTRMAWLLCGAAVALMSPVAAQAQQAPDKQSVQLDEVVVTATRSETNLQQTPVAVTAMSGDTLRDRNVATILDVTNFVPSLSIGSRSGTGTANGAVAIRGMGVDAFGSSAAVGIYVDDVYFASGAGNLLGLFDVERVEVLRGPQGTLFGRNTIAGAIQYVTRAPESTWGGHMSATGGSYSRADFEGALNIPLGETLAIRVAGMSATRSGYVHDLLADVERGAERTRAARLRAQWKPNSRLTVDLKAEVIDQRTNGRPVMVAAINPNAQFVGLAQLFGETRPFDDRYVSQHDYEFAGYNAQDYFKFNSAGVRGVATYHLTDQLTVKSVSSYATFRTRLAQDFDNTPLSILSSEPAHDNTKVFTQELQFTGKALADRLRYTFGGFYYDSKQRQDPGRNLFLGFGPGVRAGGDPVTEITSKAVYGQATFDLTDKLSVTGGLRYSSEKNTSFLIAASPPVSATFTDTSPHLGVDYQLKPGVMVYVKASKGFRAGGITPHAALPGNGLAFAPETAWTYEAGARMEFFDRRLRVNPTVFLTDWKNIQFNVLIPTPATVVAATDNAGDARIKGFELETQFAVTSRLLLTGSISLLDGEYTRVSNLTRTEYPFGFLASFPNPVTGAILPGAVVVLPNITRDTPLQRAPKTKFSLGARYAYPLDGDARLVASTDYSWTDKQSSAVTIADAVTMPSYGLLNARLQYDAPGGRWSLAGFVTNLTNKFYLVGGVDFAKGYTAGSKELDIARPREVGVEVRAQF